MYIGVDLGGTNIAAGLADDSGHLLLKIKRPTHTERGRDAIVADICEMCLELVRDSEKQGLGKPRSIGIGVPCVVDKSMALIHSAANLGEGWDQVPLKALVEAATGITTWLDNDGNLAGLAEFKAGALKGVENGLLLTLGTGVGGGFILGGRLYRGSYGLGPEVGHIVIGKNFYDCNCGQNGCFETFASATALIRHSQKMIADGLHPESVLVKAAAEGHLNAQRIFDAAKQGDLMGLQAVERYTDYLAAGIGSLINLLDPEVIALGGGVAHAGEFLMDQVKAKVKKHLLMEDYPSARLEFAVMGNDAGIIGAAMLGQMMEG